MPVASTPMVLRMCVGPCLLHHLRHGEDLGDRLDRYLRLDVAGGVDLAVLGHQGDAVDLRVDLGERRDVVGVGALLDVVVLRVGGVEGRLDLGRQSAPRAARRPWRRVSPRRRGRRRAVRMRFDGCSCHCPPKKRLALLASSQRGPPQPPAPPRCGRSCTWPRTGCADRPTRSRRGSCWRRPYWISGPNITFLARVEEHVGEGVVALGEGVRRLAVGVVDVDHRPADRAGHCVAPVEVDEEHEAETAAAARPSSGRVGLPGSTRAPMSTGASFM